MSLPATPFINQSTYAPVASPNKQVITGGGRVSFSLSHPPSGHSICSMCAQRRHPKPSGQAYVLEGKFHSIEEEVEEIQVEWEAAHPVIVWEVLRGREHSGRGV